MSMFGVACPGCARQVRIDAITCWGCGRPVTDQERAAEHVRRVQRGRRWIAIMAVVFGISGLLVFANQKADTDERERLQAQAAAAAPYGVTATAPDASALHDRLARARVRILGVNLALAGLLGLLWLWARRAPVAALASAISLLLLVWIAQSVIDRSTILDGFVLRLFALGAFAAGLRAALAARKAAGTH